MQISFGVCDLHAASAAARRSLHKNREADLLGDRHGVVAGANTAVRPRNDRNAEPLGGLLGFDLVAHGADMLGLGADKSEIVLGENFRKARILRQKAVAGMHGVRAGDLAGREQGRNIEIAVLGGRRSDAAALVGKADVHREGVGRGMHGHGSNAEFFAGTQYAQSNLAAESNQNLVEHRASLVPSSRGASTYEPRWMTARFYSMMTRGAPNSIGWPSSTRICV